jgi:hypothetical protein
MKSSSPRSCCSFRGLASETHTQHTHNTHGKKTHRKNSKKQIGKKEKQIGKKEKWVSVRQTSIFYLVKVNTFDVGRVCCETKVVG